MVVSIDALPILDNGTFYRSKHPDVTQVDMGINVKNLHRNSADEVTVTIDGVSFPVIDANATVGHIDIHFSPSWVPDGTYPIIVTEYGLGQAQLATPPVVLSFAP